jgi:hypothetical protein
MVLTKLTCPACAARLKSATPLPAGKGIKCPKCGARFPAPAAAIDPAASQLPESRPPRPPSPISLPLDAVHGEADRNRLPVSHESLQEPEKKGRQPGRKRALVIGGAVVLLVAAGITFALVTWTPPKLAAVPTEAPSQQSAEPAKDLAKLEEPAKQSGGTASQPSDASVKAVPPVPQNLKQRAKQDKPKVRAPGERPMPRDFLDQWTACIEWLLDIRLTEQQRKQFQRLCTNHGQKGAPAAASRFFDQDFQELASQLPRLDNYDRNLLRAQWRPQFLAYVRDTAGDDLSAWLLKIYRSAHRPGGKRNPVLMPGDPPLTQGMVAVYGDYIEWILGLKHSGGLTAPQRRRLGEMLLSDWKAMAESDRDDFLRLLKSWSVIAQSSAAERGKYLEVLQPRLLAELRSVKDMERARWLLEVYDKEQKSGTLGKSDHKKIYQATAETDREGDDRSHDPRSNRRQRTEPRKEKTKPKPEDVAR